MKQQNDFSQIIDFLKLNGFKKIEEKSYSNELCNVVFEDCGYAVANNKGETMYSFDFNIYWLIGVLTYYGYIDKNYKQKNY